MICKCWMFNLLSCPFTLLWLQTLDKAFSVLHILKREKGILLLNIMQTEILWEHCTVQYIVHRGLYCTVHSTKWTVLYSTQYTVDCTVQYAVHSGLYCTVHSSRWTVLYSTQYTLNCTVQYTVNCTVQYTVHSGLYCTVHSLPYWVKFA